MPLFDNVCSAVPTAGDLLSVEGRGAPSIMDFTLITVLLLLMIIMLNQITVVGWLLPLKQSFAANWCGAILHQYGPFNNRRIFMQAQPQVALIKKMSNSSPCLIPSFFISQIDLMDTMPQTTMAHLC